MTTESLTLDNLLAWMQSMTEEAVGANLDLQGLIGALNRYATFKLNKDGLPLILLPKATAPLEIHMKSSWMMQFITMRQSRALFAPTSADAAVKELYKQPICRTDLGVAIDFQSEKVSGHWLVNPHFTHPDQSGPLGSRCEVSCATCPFNRFGSEPGWDSTKISKGKACKESTTAFLVPLKKEPVRIGDVPVYGEVMEGFDEFVLARFPKASSGKDIESMVLAANSRSVPLAAIAFSVGQTKETKNGVTWAHLKVEPQGVVHPALYAKSKNEYLPKILEYIESVNSAGTDAVEALAEEADDRVTEEEIPFA